jgi:hypothetical protein
MMTPGGLSWEDEYDGMMQAKPQRKDTEELTIFGRLGDWILRFFEPAGR